MCGLPSAGLTIVADVAIATGPALLRAPRSFVLNFIYYNIRLFSVYEVSILLNLPQVVSEVFQLNAVCVHKFLFDSFCTARNKRHKIEVRRSGPPVRAVNLAFFKPDFEILAFLDIKKSQTRSVFF